MTGMTAARTPVTGATMPIRPIASPRYRAVIPMPPRLPATKAQQQVRRAGYGLTAKHGDGEREGHADDLRQQDDAEHGCAPAGQPATEVAGAPGGRSGQPERDGGRPRGQAVDQAPTPVGTVSSPASDGSSTPSSTAVGPGSSTTASAAPSYRSDVVR